MGYFRSTRHPWPCLLFLLPLVVGYELAILWLGGSEEISLRKGADAWLRGLLANFGAAQMWMLPAALVAFMLLWTSLRWKGRPKDGMGLWLGMSLESVAFALGLWAISRNFGVLLDRFGIDLAAGLTADRAAIQQIVGYIGAGIYEEVLFRLFLCGGIITVLRLVFVPSFMAVPFGMVVSSLAFAAAHHIGPNGEDLDLYLFTFRAMAGLYFAALYHYRGIGIAVGAHVLYDLIVGVPWG